MASSFIRKYLPVNFTKHNQFKQIKMACICCVDEKLCWTLIINVARALQLGPLSLCKNKFLMTETWRSLSIRGSVAAVDSFQKVPPILGTKENNIKLWNTQIDQSYLSPDCWNLSTSSYNLLYAGGWLKQMALLKIIMIKLSFANLRLFDLCSSFQRLSIISRLACCIKHIGYSGKWIG